MLRHVLRPLVKDVGRISNNYHRNCWRLNHVAHGFATRLGRAGVYAQSTFLTTTTNIHPTMSSSEEENFNLDVSGSESEDYAPAPKKKAAPKAKAPPKKAPAKPKPSKKVLAEKDDNASESDNDDDAPVAGPSGGLQEPRKKKTATETYTKVCCSVMHFH